MDKLVERINELWYDLEENYDDAMTKGMNKQEQEIWEKNINLILNKMRGKIKILDLGTGTGFVPFAIRNHLDKKDMIVCSDLSQNMLDYCSKKLKDSKCKMKFIKINCANLPFAKNSFDIITCCATLHHINNPENYLEEVKKLLKPGGFLMVGIEPNKRFFNNRFLNWQYNFFNCFKSPKVQIHKLAQHLGFEKFLQKIVLKRKKNYQIKAHKINKVLLKEKLIKKPLSIWTMRHLVERHSRKGINYKIILPQEKTISFETYFHLNSISLDNENSKIIQKYENLMKKIFPNDGLGFFIIKQKREEE